MVRYRLARVIWWCWAGQKYLEWDGDSRGSARVELKIRNEAQQWLVLESSSLEVGNEPCFERDAALGYRNV